MFPQTGRSPSPQPPYGKQDLSSEYYYVRSYQDFINMINATLAVLWYSLEAPGVLMPSNIPYMEWVHSSCTATLYADSFYFDLSNGLNPGTVKLEEPESSRSTLTPASISSSAL